MGSTTTDTVNAYQEPTDRFSSLFVLFLYSVSFFLVFTPGRLSLLFRRGASLSLRIFPPKGVLQGIRNWWQGEIRASTISQGFFFFLHAFTASERLAKGWGICRGKQIPWKGRQMDMT